MLFNTLNTPAKKSRKRVGRGISAGQGKTAGRGTKGQASRSGYRTKPNFEGGQTPLVKRLPKLKGFRSFKQPVQVIKVGQLQTLKATTVNAPALMEAGYIDSPYRPIKLIGGGELTDTKTVEVQAASAGAEKAVKAAGGSVKLVEITRPAKKASKKESK